MKCKCGHSKLDHMSSENATPGRCLNGLSAPDILDAWAHGFKVRDSVRGTCTCKKYTKKKAA